MTTQQPLRFKRFLAFFLFRLVPVILLIGAAWQAVGVAQALARYLGDTADAAQRSQSYAATASAIAPTLNALTPTFVPRGRQFLVTNTPSAALAFATNTPVALPATPTSAPTATETPLPTAIPATATLHPLPTLMLPNGPSDAAIAAAPTAIPTQVPQVDKHGFDIVNIVLMGSDGELTADGFLRTDTMIIVSVNRTTNTVSMLSLPRDLYIFIPGWTMQRLNIAYTHGEQIGWQPDGGWGLFRQAIYYNLGINVHYYALINLSGFKQIVNTLGGVDLAVDCAIQDLPLIDAAPPPEAIVGEDSLRTLPIGYYHLDGDGALWYARSRHSSSDFDRGRRQQQLLRAIWRTARSGGQLANLPTLWSQLTQVIKTNITTEDMLGFLPLALSLDPGKIEHFTLVRTYHTIPWTPPDGANVQLPVYDTIRQLLDDFYQPPTANQAEAQGARIEVYNGTGNADWDRIASERLIWDGLNAVPSGAADNTAYAETVIYDYTGQTKGSRIGSIAKLLNVRAENVISQPDPNRTTDFKIILGANYSSCTFEGVLAVN